MENPEEYMEGNHAQRKSVEGLLSEHIHLMTWRHAEDEVVLDVGCGTGDITYEVLKPLLPRGAHLVGTDISTKMVDYATNHYPDIQFQILDIGTKKLPEELLKAFDHVFSFHCLHWIQDQRQVYQNLYDLLKPGGDIFLCYVAYLSIFDAYSAMAKIDTWKDYITDVEKYIPPHQNDENTEETLKHILADVGFKIIFCKCDEGNYVYPNLHLLTNSVLGFNPYYTNIPQELKPQFSTDMINEVFKVKAVKNNNKTRTEEIVIPYKCNIIVLTKPK